MPSNDSNSAIKSDIRTNRTKKSTVPRPAGMRIVHRKLTESEAVSLLDEPKSTPRVLAYTVRDLMQFTDVFVAEDVDAVSGEITFAGACLSKDLWFGWTDIAVLYILPDYRNFGLSTELFEAAFQRATERKRHIFMMTRTPHVIYKMEELGIERINSLWESPLPIHIQTRRHVVRFQRWLDSIRNSGIPRSDSYEFVTGMKRCSG